MAPRRILKIKSISCKGIKCFNLFQKPSMYAVVSLVTGPDSPKPDHQLQRNQTPVDPDGGENPEWDHSIRFALEPDRDPNLVLRFDLTVQGGLLLLGDRIAGDVRIPVADLEAEEILGSVRHVSYQVRSSDGKPNGILRFSYKVSDPVATISLPAPQPAMPSGYYPPLADLPVYSSVPSPSPSPAFCYPPPPDPGYFYAPEPAGSYAAYPPPPQMVGYYPPPPGPMDVGYYPPPAPDCCCPAPTDQYRYRRDAWGRGLSGYG